MPIPIRSGSNFVDTLLDETPDDALWHSLTPSCPLTGVSPDLQVLVVRGVSDDHVFRFAIIVITLSVILRGRDASFALHSMRTVKDPVACCCFPSALHEANDPPNRRPGVT